VVGPSVLSWAKNDCARSPEWAGSLHRPAWRTRGDCVVRYALTSRPSFARQTFRRIIAAFYAVFAIETSACAKLGLGVGLLACIHAAADSFMVSTTYSGFCARHRTGHQIRLDQILNVPGRQHAMMLVGYLTDRLLRRRSFIPRCWCTSLS
jgi:hypothetical protein